MQLLLLAVVCACLSPGGAGEDGVATTTAAFDDGLQISAPDIYPPDGDYVGEVEVRIVANQPSSDVFYTKDGSMPTNASRYYTTPFSLFVEGHHVVRAIAVSRQSGMHDSVMRERSFNVKPAKITPPVAVPPKGVYRDTVIVKLMPAVGTPAGPNTQVQYVVDVNDPQETWQTFLPSQPIVLDTPGEHVVIARTITGAPADPKTHDNTSPLARYRYIVTPKLCYDVFTECSKCNHLPTVGYPFTVFLQNAEPGSRLFLTTSSKGCETERHRVDDTEIVQVMVRQTAYHFTTFGDGEPRVFVCVREVTREADGYVLVSRRPRVARDAAGEKVASVGVSDGSFAVEPPIGAFRRDATLPPPPTYARPPQVYVSRGGSSSGSPFSIVMISVLFLVVVGTVAVARRTGNLPTQHRAAAGAAGGAQHGDQEMR